VHLSGCRLGILRQPPEKSCSSHRRVFYACLIEEPDAGLAAAGAEAGRGFVLFLESVKAQVLTLLRQQQE